VALPSGALRFGFRYDKPGDSDDTDDRGLDHFGGAKVDWHSAAAAS
jgi:hypothetical protein